MADTTNDDLHDIHEMDEANHPQNNRGAILEGLDGLSDAAKSRVIAARRKAIEARDAAGDLMSRGSNSAADLFERQPLIIGALAFAVGAAIAATLPRTRAEDRLVGPRVSSLFGEAERVLAREKDRALGVASAMKDDLVEIASEAGDNIKSELMRPIPSPTGAANSVIEAAQDAPSRLKEAAVKAAKTTD